jgi:Ca-activated chloride channel family protein
MKSENNNPEKNISRLVKLASDSNQPNKTFTESLINTAIEEMKSKADPNTREQGSKTMKSRKILKVFAYAALIIFAVTLLASIFMPSLNRARERSKIAARYANLKSDSMMQTRRVYLAECFEEDGRPPMAHGGTTPPNGEDIDAMFFKNYGVNPFIDTEDDHLSTFAIDVDTASYTVVRGYLHDGHLPPNDAVRVEEFVNYFKYDYPAPQEDDFAVYTEAAPWSFGEGRTNAYLLRIGLKARQISDENRKPAILTFVIDTSGSMSRENRLGLVKKSLRMLVEQLRPDDKIGIATYGSRGRKLMDHKGLDEKDDILSTIELLSPNGSTYAEEGIRIGYEMAENAFKKGCTNRVILCSDGVANVGQTGADDILKIIKEKADKGITLSAIGFGMGNYNDVLMEQLGDKGNGHYAYIDTIAEAKRLFEDNLTGTLEVIARDVKVQVDFNPDVVRSYRLIGYENRDVPDEKFRDDKYDGGEVGAGHSATALYELKLWPGNKGRIATTYVRYKDADTEAVTEFKSTIDTSRLNRNFDGSSGQLRLAATVAEFAEILRHSYWAKGATLEPVLQQAQNLAEEFKSDADVIELVDLVSKARQLMPEPEPSPEPDEGAWGE